MVDLPTLIVQARAGQQDAFTELVRRHQDMAFGYAVSILRDFYLAQDVVQEACIIAYFNLGRLQDAEAFPSWLRGIIRHQCGRMVRKRQHMSVSLDDAHDLATTQPTLDEHVVREEQRSEVMGAVNQLPEHLRTVVILCYVYDHSQQQIAAFLGLPVSTVNNRLHLARKHLKKEMIAMVKDTFATHGLPDDFATNVGRVIAVTGPMLDIEFRADELPPPMSGLSINTSAEGGAAFAEVVQHTSTTTARCVILDPHGTIQPGMALMNSGKPADGPITERTLQSLVTALGAPSGAIHEVLETGIKVIDFFCPYLRGGKVAIIGDRRAGMQVVVEEILHTLGNRAAGMALLTFVHAEDVPEVWYGKTPGSSASVQTIYVPTQYPLPAALTDSLAQWDAITYLDRSLGTQGIWPAIDPLRSTSRAIEPETVGTAHSAAVQQARDLLARFPDTKNVGANGDQLFWERAQKLRAFFSQPFHVAEPYTGRPGRFVTLEETLRGVQAILAGDYDQLPAAAFLWCGPVEDAVENARALAK